MVFEIPDFEGTGSDDGLTLLVHSIWHAALEVGVCCSMVVHGFSIFARKIFQFSFEKRPSLAPTKYRKNVRHVKGVYDASLVSRGLSMTSKLDLFVNLIIFTLFESVSHLLFSQMLSCQVTRK